ncbi:hypothetical protein [Actibacterium sp.]|uniref:hypothetical protein n=1 Tax=Actibacterium sp. TaxID=1872125 RepID=UPI003563BAD2
MGNLTVPLTYAIWAVAPIVAYQALLAGLENAGPELLPLLAAYAVASVLVAMAAAQPMALIAPFLAVSALSVFLYVIGRRVSK